MREIIVNYLNKISKNVSYKLEYGEINACNVCTPQGNIK